MIPAPDLLGDRARSAIQTKGLGLVLCLVTKRLIVSYNEASEGKLPRWSHRRVSLLFTTCTAGGFQASKTGEAYLWQAGPEMDAIPYSFSSCLMRAITASTALVKLL
jgi:hypothetical protein